MFSVIVKNIFSKFLVFIFSRTKRSNIGRRVRFYGIPIIDIHKNASLIIEDGVLINSCNSGYHVNMFQKSKIFIDSPNASIKIGKNSRIHGTCIHAQSSVEIGEGCLIAANTQIIDNNGHSLSFDAPGDRINTKGTAKKVVIGNNVWIGTGCVILPGTIIGDGAVISANSVVSGVVKPKQLMRGNPAVSLEIKSRSK